GAAKRITFMGTKSLRKNPGWKLEQATIDIVAAARAKLSLTNAEVIDLWANAWQEQQLKARSGPVIGPAGIGGSGSGGYIPSEYPVDKPIAERDVQTNPVRSPMISPAEL